MDVNHAQWVTIGFLVFLAAEVVAYDALAWHLWGVDATISRVCLRISTDWPVVSVIVVFAIGIIIGHVFLSQPEPR